MQSPLVTELHPVGPSCSRLLHAAVHSTLGYTCAAPLALPNNLLLGHLHADHLAYCMLLHSDNFIMWTHFPRQQTLSSLCKTHWTKLEVRHCSFFTRRQNQIIAFSVLFCTQYSEPHALIQSRRACWNIALMHTCVQNLKAAVAIEEDKELVHTCCSIDNM